MGVEPVLVIPRNCGILRNKACTILCFHLMYTTAHYSNFLYVHKSHIFLVLAISTKKYCYVALVATQFPSFSYSPLLPSYIPPSEAGLLSSLAAGISTCQGSTLRYT